MSKRQYKFSYLQPERANSSEHLVVEDSYSVDEELIFGTEEQAKQAKQVEQVEEFEQEEQAQATPMAHNVDEQDQEVRETLQAIREGQNNIATVLQQLTGTMQHLAPINRGPPSHHSGGGSVASSPRAARAPTQNTDRPLMPIFVENNAEEEVAQPAATSLLLDNVMAMYDEWDLFPNPIKQNLTFVQDNEPKEGGREATARQEAHDAKQRPKICYE